MTTEGVSSSLNYLQLPLSEEITKKEEKPTSTSPANRTIIASNTTAISTLKPQSDAISSQSDVIKDKIKVKAILNVNYFNHQWHLLAYSMKVDEGVAYDDLKNIEYLFLCLRRSLAIKPEDNDEANEALEDLKKTLTRKWSKLVQKGDISYELYNFYHSKFFDFHRKDPFQGTPPEYIPYAPKKLMENFPSLKPQK